MGHIVKLLFVFTLLFNFCCVPPHGPTPIVIPGSVVQTQGMVLRHVTNSTVALVEDRGHDHIGANCSGVFVSPTVILTAHHCIRNEESDDEIGRKVYYVLKDDVESVSTADPSTIHRAMVIATDENHDLALLRIASHIPPVHEIVSLAHNTPSSGSTIYWVGAPSGLYFSVGQGSVAGERDFPDESGKMLQINGTGFWFGCSGGPIVNDAGELVAISDAIIRGSGIGFGVHLDSVKEFLKANKV